MPADVYDKENVPAANKAPRSTKTFSSSLYSDYAAAGVALSPCNRNKGFAGLLSDASMEAKAERRLNVAKSDARYAKALAEKERVAEEKARKEQEEADYAESKLMEKHYIEDELRQVGDHVVAKKMLLQEREEEAARKRMEDNDAKLALEVAHKEELLHKAQLVKAEAEDKEFAFKVAKEVDDELLAEDMDKKERDLVEQEKERIRMDKEVASKIIADEVRGLVTERAFRMSREQQDMEMAQQTAEDERHLNELERRRREEEDAAYARKLEKNMSREDHRRQMRKHIHGEETKDDLSYIERQMQIWEDPTVKFLDVQDGICISLHLPFVMTLDVKVGSARSIQVTAKRLPFTEEQLDSYGRKCPPCSFSGDLQLCGDSTFKLAKEDINYEYSSEDELLHVFVENICLSKMSKKEKSSFMSSTLRTIRSSLLGRR